MEKEQKKRVLELFLQYIQKYVPLGELIIASLGGEGREAKLWQAAGIPGKNGWLIERKREQSRQLIAKLPYRYTQSLGNFSKIFRTVAGPGKGVDAFHLDLCGTIEPSVNIMRRIVPLVVKSRGRCLAITVADTRRNLSVEQFCRIEQQLSKLLGIRYERMREQLLGERSGDRQLAVMRELGFFYHLMDLLKFYGRYAMPAEVRRYTYISHTTGTAFPMRTYFFRFEEEPLRMPALEFAKLLQGKWLQKPLVDLNNNRSAPDSAADRESGMSPNVDKYGKLRGIAELAGGETLQQFNDLAAELLSAREAAGETSLINELRALTAKYAAQSDEPSAGSKRSANVRSTPSNRVLDGPRIEAQLQLVKAQAKGPQKLERAKTDIARRLKFGRKKNKGFILGGLHARTQGKFRGKFMVRVGKYNPDLINDELASCYTAITGKTVTAAELRKEAGL